ncbi:MAG TPA: hypothetical protein VGV89_09560 [Thermoplasmata archaeon]|nr:hypothetical protein [Thermoplasmata archaeon]
MCDYDPDRLTELELEVSALRAELQALTTKLFPHSLSEDTPGESNQRLSRELERRYL